jgi:hypothetical protein
VVIENYYITGVYSTNPRNEKAFYVYIYLPNNYNIVNDLLDLLAIQLTSMQATEYPTSTTCMISALTIAIMGDPPTDEFDDDPIKTTSSNIST